MRRRLTLDIPHDVFRRLAYRAEETGRTIEAVAEDLLTEAAEDFIDPPAEIPIDLHPVPARPSDPMLG
jgi:hypothetical protein